MLFFSKLDYIVTTLTPRPEDQELDSIDQTLQDTFSVRSSHTVPIAFAHLLCIFLSINLFSAFTICLWKYITNIYDGFRSMFCKKDQKNGRPDSIFIFQSQICRQRRGGANLGTKYLNCYLTTVVRLFLWQHIVSSFHPLFV